MYRRGLIAAASGLALACPALAQSSWPDRPIRWIVPFPPGGSTDLWARLMAEPMAAELGQPIVIENRAGGAAGLIGSEAVAKSAADGYTILVHSNAHVIAPCLVSRMPFDVIGDFTALGHLGRVPQVLVVNKALPINDLPGLIAWLRANSGKINFASAGIGSGNHLATEVLRAALPGVEMELVQFRGGGPAMQAVISGSAHMCIDPIPSAVGHITGGSVRAIAVAGPTRSAALPDVPSATEGGLPAWDIAAWFGAFAPARTPRAAVAAWNAAFNSAMEKLQPRLTELAVERQPQIATPEAMNDFVKVDLVRVAGILRAAGVRPE